MTIVEFYDKVAVENMASTLLCSPDKVIFVGDNEKRMLKSIEIYKSISAERNLNVEFEYRKISRNNLLNCISVLSNIVENNDNCVFDIEGGEELYLVALGVVLKSTASVFRYTGTIFKQILLLTVMLTEMFAQPLRFH